MTIDTITTDLLVVAPLPVCDRCRKTDRHGLSGWLGVRLCGLCLLVAKARRS